MQRLLSIPLVPPLVLLFLLLFAFPALASPEDALPFLKDGNAALLKGSYMDAVRLFGEALGQSTRLAFT